jgi:4'-phosphopantetheinyl transferase
MIWPALVLPKSSVDLWSLSLDLAVGEHEWDVLPLSERQRAHRFRREIDRDRFVVCRSVLRRILGAYLDRVPERLEFEYGEHGKPFLAGEALHFNVSHADGKSLIVVTCAGPVGVDLEPEARAIDVDGVAKTVCSRSEYARISALPAADRRLALLRIWVAKEAFLKSTGQGLTRPLDHLDASELTVRFIDAMPGFVSAIALPSFGLPVRILEPRFALNSLNREPLGRADLEKD